MLCALVIVLLAATRGSLLDAVLAGITLAMDAHDTSRLTLQGRRFLLHGRQARADEADLRRRSGTLR
jgi:hypothetical protein